MPGDEYCWAVTERDRNQKPARVCHGPSAGTYYIDGQLSALSLCHDHADMALKKYGVRLSKDRPKAASAEFDAI